MADEIERLIRDLGGIPKEMRRMLRPGLRKAGGRVLTRARSNASWSTRIPGATRIAVKFAGREPGVSIVTNAKRAPHARPYEGITGEATFRHPVFGNREVWVTQRTRPFLAPAADTEGDAVEKDIADVVDTVVRFGGFR